MLTFRLTSKSNVPPYVQLVEQVRQALMTGVLRAGDRLPTVREVVESLAINPNTVLKAYRELEREGLVEGRQGIGTFVLRRPDGPPPGTHALLARGLADLDRQGPQRRAARLRHREHGPLDAALVTMPEATA